MSTKLKDLLASFNTIDSQDLSRAHAVVRNWEGDTAADSLDAVIHRREGDVSNSLYRWQRVGQAAPAELLKVYGNETELTNAVRLGKQKEHLDQIQNCEFLAPRAYLQRLAEQDGK